MSLSLTPPRERPWPWWLAIALTALIGVLLIAVLIMTWINVETQDVWLVTDFPLQIIVVIAYMLVGLLLAVRRPHNALGWLFLGIGIIGATSALLRNWAVYGLETSPGAPGAALALWVSIWISALAIAPIFPLLLFPSGRLEDRPSRVVAGMSVVAIVLLIIALMTSNETPLHYPDLYRNTPNPLADNGHLISPALAVVLVGFCGLLAFGLLLKRFRESRGQERQQYKWVVIAMTLMATDFVFRSVQTEAYLSMGPGLPHSSVFVPIAMGVAILRHQLFDIDRVVHRTLVYTTLSIGLLGVYGLSVVLFQFIFQPLTRGADFAVATTTLLLAALFRPLRSGIQRLVDRRFNRERYDASRTIEQFSVRMREEVDLETVGSELNSVVHETMQPEHVSLWLKPMTER